MPYVRHPNGKPAREIVAGRIVRFDDQGVARVTVPHLLARYADADGYAVADEPRRQLVPEAASTESLVRMVHPDWDEETVHAEVQAIHAEQRGTDATD